MTVTLMTTIALCVLFAAVLAFFLTKEQAVLRPVRVRHDNDRRLAAHRRKR